MKLKVNDQIMVIAGKDKGKTGKIIRINHKTNKVTVEKINLRVKHIKKGNDRVGEKITVEAPLSASNVMIVDPKSGKPTRIKYQKLSTGKKERISVKSGSSLDGVSQSNSKTTKKSK